MMNTAIIDPQNNDFELAVCRELGTLERMALWHTGNPDDAADLVQDTVVLAIRFKESYRNGSNLKAWLLKVMRNRHISMKRRHTLERRVFESEAEYALTDWSISETVRRNREQGGGVDRDNGFSDTVANALDALRPEFRAVVFMCDIEDMTYMEAAEKASCPVGTVMSRLHRGRRALKDMLGSRKELDAA